MKTSIQRRVAKITLALATACVIGAAIAAAPGPTSIGEFYYYFDASGNTELLGVNLFHEMLRVLPGVLRC